MTRRRRLTVAAGLALALGGAAAPAAGVTDLVRSADTDFICVAVGGPVRDGVCITEDDISPSEYLGPILGRD